jgi:hypothetical protein
MKKAAEIAGWYGIVAILGAYALVSFSVIGSDSVLFQLLNLTGALGVIWITAIKGVTQSVVLNTVWAIIAVVALLRMVIA